MSSNNGGQYPLRSNEKVQQLFRGSNPVAVADASTLSYVLDPRLSTPCNSSFSIRHGRSAVVTLGETGDGRGTYLAAGDATRCNASSYLSLQTTHAVSATSNVMVERVRIGQEGLVTIASNSTLNIVGNAVFYGSTVFNGVTYYGGYGNLVNNYTSSSLILPPTANALSLAYSSLSNLLVSRLNSFYSSNALYAPDLAFLAASASNAPYGWWIAQNGNETLVAGPVACSTLFVAPGGCIVASSYCNLVDNYAVSDMTRPPSADALNAAYLQLSNQIYMQIQQAQLYGIVNLNQGGAIPAWGGTATAFQSDMWLRSSDGNNRVLFPSASNSPVTFSAGPSTSPSSTAFVWNCNLGVGGSVMSLSQGGTLSLAGGIRACPLNATNGWSFVYDPLASNLSLSNASLVTDGSAAFAGGVTIGSNATVRGTFTAGTYSNLPYAGFWPNGTPGVVLLVAELSDSLEGSNLAATASALKASSVQVNSRCDNLQALLSEAVGALVMASNASVVASNIALSEVLQKAYGSPSVVNGLTLTNNSTSSNAGVSIRLGVGVGPSPQDITTQLRANPAFVADSFGSNCASISVITSPLTGFREMDLSGPTTVTYGSNSSVIVEPSCVLAIGQQVDVRQGPSGQAYLPSDNPMGNTGGAWTDPSSGASYAISSSSVLFSDSLWCAPYQGVSTTPTTTPWISASGTYDSGTGNPTGTAASTGNVVGSGAITGEWLQVDLSPGAFVNQFKVVAPVDLVYIPNNFVLLASTTPVSGPGGAQWNVVSANIANQGPALAAAGSAGLTYSVNSSRTNTRFVAFRLVVTKIYIATGYLPSGTVQANVQVDVFKLVGSVFAPLPNLLFTVNQNSLVVDRYGYVGVGTVAPSAPIHVASLDGLVAYAGSQGVPGVILLDSSLSSNSAPSDFRGWSVSPDGLLQTVETYDAHHAFFAGSNELMRIGADGNVGIATVAPEATLDLAGTLVVRSNAVLKGASTTACNLTVLGTLSAPALTATIDCALGTSNFAFSSVPSTSNAAFFASNVASTSSNAVFASLAFDGSNLSVRGPLSTGDIVAKGVVSSSNIVAASNVAFSAFYAASFGSNLSVASSNPAFFGSNTAYVSLATAIFGSNVAVAASAASNPAFYGSNAAYAALNAALYSSNNVAIASSNPAFYGSNTAYLTVPIASFGSNVASSTSNPAFYGSNAAYAALNAALYSSNNVAVASSNPAFFGSNTAYQTVPIASFGSNVSASTSNPAFFGSNAAYAATPIAVFGSNIAASTSNPAFYGSNSAYVALSVSTYASNLTPSISFGSNAASWASNLSSASSNPAFYGSNAAYAALSLSQYGSNVVIASSNPAYFGSNAAYVALSVAFFSSNNLTPSSSNPAFFGSNLAYSMSNAVYFGSNQAFLNSNPACFGSNFAYTFAATSSNAIFWTSNSQTHTSNATYAASNPAFLGSNLAYTLSNALYGPGSVFSIAFGSNAAVFGCNVAIRSSNPAFFGSNLAYSMSNAVYFGSNQAFLNSNPACFGSNFAYTFALASSNAIFWTSNSQTSTSNATYATSNTSYATSNPAFFGSNLAYVSSNPTYFGSNMAYAASNPAFAGSNVAFITSNAVFKNFLFSSSNSSGVTYPYVGIGTTTPAYPLHITVPATTAPTSIWVTGDIVSLSDRSVKQDIEPIPGALEKVRAIGGYTYNMGDGDGPQRHVGVIAQEVEAVLKEAVYVDKETGYKSVAYGNLVALLIEAIKEMHDGFERRLKDLENARS